MAIQEHIELLQQGTDKWNSWRAKHQDTVIDLKGADLSRADLSGTYHFKIDLNRVRLSRPSPRYNHLSGVDLSEADLSKADLNRARLIAANLSGANLSGANLSRADLIGANLIGANLNRTDLMGANLNRADLSGARLIGAIAGETHFDNIDLRGIKGLETIDHRGPSNISTSTLERSQGDIPEVFLRGAGLSDTFIEYVRSFTVSPGDCRDL